MKRPSKRMTQEKWHYTETCIIRVSYKSSKSREIVDNILSISTFRKVVNSISRRFIAKTLQLHFSVPFLDFNKWKRLLLLLLKKVSP